MKLRYFLTFYKMLIQNFPAFAASSTETVTHANSAHIAIFGTAMLPIQQFYSLASASYGIFSNSVLSHSISRFV